MTKTTRATSKAKASAPAFINPPKAVYMDIAELKSRFGDQAMADPVESQRNHLVQNASGRAHIKTEMPPTTQAVIHAVEVVGKHKRKLTLIDGYHRIAYWLMQERCPFLKVLVIIHEIKADTAAEFSDKVDLLASTIDNRAAVKSNADRWCAAIRDAGLDAKSQAYQLGLRSRTHLHRSLGSAKVRMSVLTEKAKAGIEAHRSLDLVYYNAEQHTSIKCQNEYLHAGVAQALYTQFMKKSVNATALIISLNAIYDKLGAKKGLAAKVMLTKQEAVVYNLLIELATDERQKDLKSRGNRETYYTEVALELTPALDALRKVCSRRKLKAVI